MAKQLVIGLAAHVDAGKTTLSEAMLYLSGAVRRQGRVDHGDTWLDTGEMEKERGITIFSKEARLTWKKNWKLVCHTGMLFPVPVLRIPERFSVIPIWGSVWSAA